MRSVWQLLTSLTSSAASSDDTGTMRAVTRAKSAEAASRPSASSPPTTCGSSSSSRRACPCMVRSGAKASRARPHMARSSGRTTDRLAPTGTVLLTMTTVLGAQLSATWRAAARRLVSSASCVSGLTGVETQMMAASTPPLGSAGPTWRRSPRKARTPSSTPGSKRWGRPWPRASRTTGEVSTPWTVKPLRARVTARVSPT